MSYLNFRPDQPEENRLKDEPQAFQGARHPVLRVVLRPAAEPPPAEAGDEGHDEDGERAGAGQADALAAEEGDEAAAEEEGHAQQVEAALEGVLGGPLLINGRWSGAFDSTRMLWTQKSVGGLGLNVLK